MKKLKVLGLMALMTFVLAGCQQNSSDREEVLEEQIAQLEQQVTSLEKEKEEASSQAENVSNSGEAENKPLSDDSLKTLEDAVMKVVAEADKSNPSGSREENQTRFFEMKGKLQEIEDRLDRFEDNIESQYRQGKIDYEKARKAEIELERLEDQLDKAEDSLENRFGYDD